MVVLCRFEKTFEFPDKCGEMNRQENHIRARTEEKENVHVHTGTHGVNKANKGVFQCKGKTL